MEYNNHTKEAQAKERVSNATRRNWERLNASSEGRLQARANKTLSQKRFVPVERVRHGATTAWVETFVAFLLSSGIAIESALYALIVHAFKKHGIDSQKNVRDFLAEYAQYASLKVVEVLSACALPEDEFDIFGTIYQSYLSEGVKNEQGSYYTPEDIVKAMVSDWKVREGQYFLDPACGCGAFLLTVDSENPEHLFGMDTDPIAVMLAKANLLLRYCGIEFTPRIVVGNFLTEREKVKRLYEETHGFHYIATNPPWGTQGGDGRTVEEIASGEASSAFYVQAAKLLADEGEVNLLLPVSLLNVRTHRDFRSYVLNHLGLEEIRVFANLFRNVVTKFAYVKASKRAPQPWVSYVEEGVRTTVARESFLQTEGLVFNRIVDLDQEILGAIRQKGNLTLAESGWALGVVTGDNKRKLHDRPLIGEEPIYTGKEVTRYCLLPARKYIRFDRSQLQQAAKDCYYRAPEKLVYKFIGRKLTFAYDDSASLVLNSANILIPKIPGLSIKAVLALLNSSIYQYLYITLFNEIKVLKKNLMELPFPQLTKKENKQLTALVDAVLVSRSSDDAAVQTWLQTFYGLNDRQMEHIQQVVHGKDRAVNCYE